jgi:hypothetical protein
MWRRAKNGAVVFMSRIPLLMVGVAHLSDHPRPPATEPICAGDHNMRHAVKKMTRALLGCAIIGTWLSSAPAILPTITLSPGANIQAAVTAAPAGTVFVLLAGVYRMQTIVPKDGDTFTGQGSIDRARFVVETFQPCLQKPATPLAPPCLWSNAPSSLQPDCPAPRHRPARREHAAPTRTDSVPDAPATGADRAHHHLRLRAVSVVQFASSPPTIVDAIRVDFGYLFMGQETRGIGARLQGLLLFDRRNALSRLCPVAPEFASGSRQGLAR